MKNIRKIIMLCGLPGSGKSFLGDAIFDECLNHTAECPIFLDDMGTDHTLEDLAKAVEDEYELIIISDVNLCREEARISATERIKEIAPDYQIEWTFFENDPAKCLKNVDYRDDGRLVKGLITHLSKSYTIPSGAAVKKIWQPPV